MLPLAPEALRFRTTRSLLSWPRRGTAAVYAAVCAASLLAAAVVVLTLFADDLLIEASGLATSLEAKAMSPAAAGAARNSP